MPNMVQTNRENRSRISYERSQVEQLRRKVKWRASMWWVVTLVLALVALIGYTVLLNAGPTRCPSCRRINIFRRKRTGQKRDRYDEEGVLRRRSTEYTCGRCGSRYWLIWDDFEGGRAFLSLAPEGEAESGATP
jgi:uncharacterized protein with PIN domain